MNARLLPDGELETWDTWLGRVDGANMHQTAIYRRALSLYGHRSEILVVEDGGRFLGGALLAIRRPGPVVGPLVRTSGGLAVTRDGDPGAMDALAGAVVDRARQLRASRLEVSLRIPVKINDTACPRGEEAARSLGRQGFQPTGSMGTYVVDLGVEDDDRLLATLGERPRQLIEDARGNGVMVERTDRPADFIEFEHTHRDMCQRRGYDRMPEGFPTEVFLPLVRSGLGDLFVARRESVPLGYIFVGTIGIPIRHERAITATADAMGPLPMEALLHHSAMCHYRARGQPGYDLGGAQGAVPDPSHPDYETWRFKYELQGAYVEFGGTWTRTLRPLDAVLLSLLRRGLRARRSMLGR